MPAARRLPQPGILSPRFLSLAPVPSSTRALLAWQVYNQMGVILIHGNALAASGSGSAGRVGPL